jgi:hypothetical protein
MLMKDLFQQMEGEICHYSLPSDLIQGSDNYKNMTFEQYHELQTNTWEKYCRHTLLLWIVQAQIFCHSSTGKLN